MTWAWLRWVNSVKTAATLGISAGAAAAVGVRTAAVPAAARRRKARRWMRFMVCGRSTGDVGRYAPVGTERRPDYGGRAGPAEVGIAAAGRSGANAEALHNAAA